MEISIRDIKIKKGVEMGHNRNKKRLAFQNERDEGNLQIRENVKI